MTGNDLPPLEKDVRALLDRAGDILPAPVDVQERVLARVEALVLPTWGGGADNGAGVHPGAVATHIGVLRRLLPFAATFALGSAVGAAAMHAAERPHAKAVVHSVPAASYVDSLASSNPTASSSPSSSALSSSPSPGPPARSQPSSDTGLALERAGLDVARAAIERGDGATALTATREHERRFPNGLLVQEREAMAIRALVMLGRGNEARARALRFRTGFPGSMLLPAIESAVAAPSASP
jgi:hypothetical protein